MAKLNARMQSNFSGCFHAGECTVAVKLSGKSSNIFFFTSFRKSSRTCISVFWSCEEKRKKIQFAIVLSRFLVPKKSFARRRHIAHVSFHILSWLSCGYWISIMGKFLASNSEKDIDIQCNWLTLAPRITNNQNKNSLVMAKDFIWKYKLWVWRNTTQHHCIKRFFYSHTVLAGECRWITYAKNVNYLSVFSFLDALKAKFRSLKIGIKLWNGELVEYLSGF